jgi:hypothetical protein
MLRKNFGPAAVGLLTIFSVSTLFAEEKPVRHERRPAASPESATPVEQKQPNYIYFSILNGGPKGLTLHHDTEVGSNKPIDVYLYPIEMQVVNSDGNAEPEGLIIDNFYTAHAQDPQTAPNPNNARDCKIWNALVLNEIKNRNPKSPTWSYVEFVVAEGARTIDTNEDGKVFWSDDIECWGSRDRFAPF